MKPEVLENIVDPWGSQLLYFYPGKSNPSEYELISLGPDRVISDDDLTIYELIG